MIAKLSIEIDIRTGLAAASVQLPKGDSPQNCDSLASRFASLIVALNSGQLLPMLQKAIAGAGQPGEEGVPMMILNYINRIVANQQGSPSGDDVLIPPTRVFSVPVKND